MKPTGTTKDVRFRISTHQNGYYCVSIPNYDGGEVVRVEEYERLQATQANLITVLKEAMKIVSDKAAGGRMLTTIEEASDIYGRCAKAILDAQPATPSTSAGGG